jgi:7-cyano-7-deazaguanine synthase in queuosine biosynthesis
MKFTRFVGARNRNPAYRAALRERAFRKLDLRPAEGNITLDFKIDGEPLALPMTPIVRDLVDLATMIYAADELCERNTTADRWTRTFDAVIPVRSPALWRTTGPQLQELLKFLSGDVFRFEWTPTRTVPPLRNHRAVIPNGFEMVCLFSGGSDSLVGAYELLQQGRKVLLVGHQADGITASTQDRLMQFLKHRFDEQVVFVQARVARSLRAQPEFELGAKLETTHRPRSFLFLCLAVAVASATDINEIVLPENGLIALNPPLDASRVGTLSTRTAHPYFLSGYSAWVRALRAFRGRIWNPFLYMSKTDVVCRAPRPLQPVLRQTLSCSHLGRSRWIGFNGRHCGYCIPCLYRRIAFAERDLDDPADYYRNVFTRFGSLSSTERSDVRALAAFAKRVRNMSTAERMAAVLSQGVCDPDTLAAMGPQVEDPCATWVDMLDRWTAGFLGRARTWSSRDVRRRLNI